MGQPQSFFEFKATYDANGDVTFENKTTKQPLTVTDIIDNIYSPEYRNTHYTDKEYKQDWRAFISLCLIATKSYKFYCSSLANDSIPNLPRTFIDCEESLNHIGCYPSVTQLPENW